jgi:hypothetical protein
VSLMAAIFLHVYDTVSSKGYAELMMLQRVFLLKGAFYDCFLLPSHAWEDSC